MKRTCTVYAPIAVVLLLCGTACDIATTPAQIGSSSDELEIEDQGLRERCAAASPTTAQRAGIERRVRDSWENFDALAADGVITIPVYFHVMYENSGKGNIPDAQIQAQIALLNQAFSGALGGANTRFAFSLEAITRTKRTTWFRYIRDEIYERQMKSALRAGGASTLNIYAGRPTGGVLGWSSFPWSFDEDAILDGVVVHYTTLPGGSNEKYNEGDTLVHEVGHWLGLWHTFEGGCAGGDQVEDTPPQGKPNWTCSPGQDSCLGGGLDPIANFMNYTEDSCMYEFTLGQARRAREIHAVYRNGDASIPRITARRAGWNGPKLLLR